MKLPIYQVDAFTSNTFGGNPAAVCVLESWLSDELMQQIAMENNLAETAFLVKNDQEVYEIRWFTPEVEVALCGHATLASSYVLFEYYKASGNLLKFYSHRSGPLSVEKGDDGLLILDFPADQVQEIAPLDTLNEAMGTSPVESHKGKTDYLLVYRSQSELEALTPNFHLLSKVPVRGVIATAKGDSVDFVSRFFAPQSGIPEDPVTGSAHTSLTPYWAKVLGKAKMEALQLSARKGSLSCELLGDRVKIAGKAMPYLVGEISVPS